MPLNVNSSSINCDNLYSGSNANPSYDYSSATNQSSINSSNAAVYSRSQNYSFCTYNNKGCTTPPTSSLSASRISTTPPLAAYTSTSSGNTSGISTTPPVATYTNISSGSTSVVSTTPPTSSGSTSVISTTPPTSSGSTTVISTAPPTSSISTSGISTAPPSTSESIRDFLDFCSRIRTRPPVAMEKSNPKDYTNRSGISTEPTTSSENTSGSSITPPNSSGSTSTTGTTNSSDDSTDFVDVDDLEHIDDEISSYSIGNGKKNYNKLTEKAKIEAANWLNDLGYKVKIDNKNFGTSISTPIVVESSFLTAIKEFQEDHCVFINNDPYNLAVTGEPNKETLAAISSEYKLETVGKAIIIPDKVTGKVNGKSKTLYPSINWGIVGCGGYPAGVQKDSQGRYKVAVAPRIIDPDYPDNGKIWGSDFANLNKNINVVLINKTTGKKKTIQCVVVDYKAHSFSKYPAGQKYKTGDTAQFDVENGIIQTGIAYPNSYNATKSEAFAENNIDGSVIEFTGHAVDFDINQYELVKIMTQN